MGRSCTTLGKCYGKRNAILFQLLAQDRDRELYVLSVTPLSNSSSKQYMLKASADRTLGRGGRECRLGLERGTSETRLAERAMKER